METVPLLVKLKILLRVFGVVVRDLGLGFSVCYSLL